MKSALVMLLLASAPVIHAEEKSAPDASAQTRAIMHTIYGDLQTVFPLSFVEKEFANPKNKKKVLDGLNSLQDHASVLHEHFKGMPVSAFVADALQQDAKDAARWYTSGAYRQSAFVIHHMVENCISCHERSPEIGKFVNSADFAKVINTGRMEPEERIKILTATRQFDGSLDAIEQYLLQSQANLNKAFIDGTMIDYLRISIQVKRDLKRPSEFLAKLQTNSALPQFASKLVAGWQEDLKRLVAKEALKRQDPITEIKFGMTQIANAGFGSESAGLVNYIYLATQLHDLLKTNLTPDQQSESYYLLGYIENAVEHSFWISETKFYLQAAINVAPHKETAEKAYLLLEELTTLGFTGSAGTNVPGDVMEWLKDLKAKAQIIDKDQKS